MAQTKTEFNVEKIVELVDKVIAAESIPKESESYADLGWIKIYAKDLLKGCKDCGQAPSGSQSENSN